MVVPPQMETPRWWSFLVGKSMGLLGKPTILGFTPIYMTYTQVAAMLVTAAQAARPFVPTPAVVSWIDAGDEGLGVANVVPEAVLTNLNTVNKQVFVCFFSHKK